MLSSDRHIPSEFNVHGNGSHFKECIASMACQACLPNAGARHQQHLQQHGCTCRRWAFAISNACGLTSLLLLLSCRLLLLLACWLLLLRSQLLLPLRLLLSQLQLQRCKSIHACCGCARLLHSC